MKPIAWLYASVGLCLACVPFAAAQDDKADKKTMKRILAEVTLMPSLYDGKDAAIRVKTLPPFSSLKLVSYPIGKINTADRELELWKKDKMAYSQIQPARSALFDGAEIVTRFQQVDLPTTLSRPFGIKEKADLLKRAESIGLALFKLEQVLEQMQAAPRDTKSRRWLANTDLARARLQGNVVFLYEYSLLLGQIRADALPELGEGNTGWRIENRPQLSTLDGKVRALAKARLSLLDRLQEDHAATPWAYFAERESQRALGMRWQPKK